MLEKLVTLALALGLSMLAPAQAASGSPPEDCAALASRTIQHTTIDSARITDPPFVAPGTGRAVTQRFCRVTGTIKPKPTSNIKFELWLPLDWNGRYFQGGNGGNAGVIRYDALAGALADGYAAAGTDDGTSPVGSFDWVGDPDRLLDWQYRAAHLTAAAGKALTAAFYGRAPHRSYFVGGSKGGQEALAEAQMFPGDFDGILSYYPSGGRQVVPLMLWATQQMNAKPGSRLTLAKMKVLNAGVMAACGGKDGGLASDSFLTYPPACHFDPAVLLCKTLNPVNCLTADEIATAKAIYKGPAGHDLGLFPGSEWPIMGPAHGWDLYSGPMVHDIIAPNIAMNVVGKPAWDYRSFDFARDMPKFAARFDRQYHDAINPDLSAFQARGGKLMVLHGWSDPFVPAQHSIQYFDHVVAFQRRALGAATEKDALDATQSFYRLFMVPGLGHGPSAGLRPLDPLGALVAWVERDQAPDTLAAAQYRDDDPAKGVILSRALCAWPLVNQSIDGGRFACRRPVAAD